MQNLKNDINDVEFRKTTLKRHEMPENDIKTTADIFQFLPTFSPLKRHHLSETTSSGKPVKDHSTAVSKTRRHSFALTSVTRLKN